MGLFENTKILAKEEHLDLMSTTEPILFLDLI